MAGRSFEGVDVWEEWEGPEALDNEVSEKFFEL